MKQKRDFPAYRYSPPIRGQSPRMRYMLALEQKQRRHVQTRRALSVLVMLFFVTSGVAVAVLIEKNLVVSAKPTAVAPPATLKAAQTSNLTPKLAAALAPVVAAHAAAADVAIYDHRTGQTAEYSNATPPFNTASIVKLSILEELLLQDQAAGTGITDDQLAEATPMIENSDNDAATELWQDVGAGTTMQEFFNQVGATSTYVNPAGHWGLTETTALDQLKILNQFAYPTNSSLLNASSIATISGLLGNVEPDQQWGISAGAPTNATVELKDGWLEDTGGWDVNSIGYVSGTNADYTIAILTKNNSSEQAGISTVKALSAAAGSLLSI